MSTHDSNFTTIINFKYLFYLKINKYNHWLNQTLFTFRVSGSKILDIEKKCLESDSDSMAEYVEGDTGIFLNILIPRVLYCFKMIYYWLIAAHFILLFN